MALACQEEIVAFADALSGIADSLHERVIQAAQQKSIDQATAQSLSQQESILRQKVEALYAVAAERIVAGLTEEQSDLLAVVRTARQQIQSIQDLRDALELVGHVIVLGASIYAGQPGPILAALKDIKEDLH